MDHHILPISLPIYLHLEIPYHYIRNHNNQVVFYNSLILGHQVVDCCKFVCNLIFGHLVAGLRYLFTGEKVLALLRSE
jgi:hypothetical protein